MNPPPVSGRAVSPETIVPADVLARVQWVREELEAIRFEMGKPQDRRVTRLATDALPHEVYFQAVTLFIKADRLALELTGSTGIRPEPVATTDVRPYHNVTAWKYTSCGKASVLRVRGIRLTPTQAYQDTLTTHD